MGEIRHRAIDLAVDQCRLGRDGERLLLVIVVVGVWIEFSRRWDANVSNFVERLVRIFAARQRRIGKHDEIVAIVPEFTLFQRIGQFAGQRTNASANQTGAPRSIVIDAWLVEKRRRKAIFYQKIS